MKHYQVLVQWATAKPVQSGVSIRTAWWKGWASDIDDACSKAMDVPRKGHGKQVSMVWASWPQPNV